MIDDILNLIFPGKCIICQNVFLAEKQNAVCADCLSSVFKKKEVYYCKSCGKPSENCQDCLKNRKYDYIYVFTKNTESFTKIISEYKLNRVKGLGLEIAKFIKDDIEKVVRENNIDIVTYVPLSKKLQKERGFNHLEFVLRNIFPSYLIREVLVKIKETKLQVHLLAEERKKNLKGAFKLVDDVKDKNILVFDDILTTGSTMLEVYKEIKKGKPKKIYGYIIGR